MARWLAIPMGLLFGFLLHRGGVADYNVIVRQFRFRDFTVLKIMFTAILVGGVGVLVLHVSALAAHTGHLRKRPQAALMVTASETPGQPVHALPRLSLQVQARLLSPQDADWPACRAAYLARFPDAEPMTQLADFCFAALQPIAGRHVAGFGAARSVDAPTLRDALTPPNP